MTALLDTDRDQEGYYLEYQGGFGNQLFVTAGARYDDNDDFGTHTSYRASGAYLIAVADGELKLKATYGTGFRAPSLYEIAYQRSPFAFPPRWAQSSRRRRVRATTLGILDIRSGLYWKPSTSTRPSAMKSSMIQYIRLPARQR